MSDDIFGEITSLLQVDLKKRAFAKKLPPQNELMGSPVLVKRYGDPIKVAGTIVRYDVELVDDVEVVYIELEDGIIVTNLNHTFEITNA